MNRFTRVINNFFRAIDPPIGEFLLAHQINIYGIREDGRMPDKIHMQGGFPAVLNHDEVLKITRSRFENYQAYNVGRIGLGAASSYDHLCQAYNGNAQVGATRCIYGLFGRAIYLPRFNAELFGESADKDYEKEYLLLEKIALNRILFATTPEHRQAFEEGLRVPNEMMTFNARLPRYVTKSDINDLQSILSWLLDNHAIYTASKLCKFMFKDKSALNISQQLQGNQTLIQEVSRLLTIKPNTEPVDEQPTSHNSKKLEM